jgi:O-antigen/teichoic acid export membrane protein
VGRLSRATAKGTGHPLRALSLSAIAETIPNSAGHGQRRNRRAVVNGIAAVSGRFAQIAVSLVTVPLTIRYLGKERFGLWMTVSSVLAVAAFADFGIGNGILNSVSDAYGKDDRQTIHHVVSSGLAVLSAIGAFLLVGFFCIYPLVSWADLFRVASPLARTEAGPSMAIFAICFCLNVPFGAIQRVQMGLQESYLPSLWQVCGAAVSLAGVVVGIRMHTGLPFLLAAIAGAPVLAAACNTAQFFGFKRRDLFPQRRMVSYAHVRRIAVLGGLFFVLQAVVAVAFSADGFIVARSLGAVAVPDYSIPQRMFLLISTVVAMMVSPLWPAYGEAISRGDIRWVHRTLVRSLAAVFGGTCLVSGLLLLFSRRLIFWWVGPQINPPTLMLLGLAVWTVLDCCGTTVAMFMNGASIMRFQIVTASLFGIACVTAKIVFLRRYGIAAVPWSTLSTYVLFNALPSAIYILRRFGDDSFLRPQLDGSNQMLINLEEP